MNLQQFVFYSFSFLTMLGASMVILAKNPVRAVLSLVLTFFSTAVIWMLLESEFLSVVLVLVYVGAILVLFLFVVMMLDIELASIREGFSRYLPFGTIISVLFAALFIRAAGPDQFGLRLIKEPPPHPVTYSNIKALGTLLYTDYLYALELAGILLLVAMVAAIGLTFRGKRGCKSIDPKWQVRVSKEDRIRLVKLPKGDDE